MSEALARKLHEAYERLAPQFGYQTREDTRAFDPESPNGKLMIAVCGECLSEANERAAELARKEQAVGIDNINLRHEVERLRDGLSEGSSKIREEVRQAYEDDRVRLQAEVNRLTEHAQDQFDELAAASTYAGLLQSAAIKMRDEYRKEFYAHNAVVEAWPEWINGFDPSEAVDAAYLELDALLKTRESEIGTGNVRAEAENARAVLGGDGRPSSAEVPPSEIPAQGPGGSAIPNRPWQSVYRDYPNLEAVMVGCVSGRATEWPMVREELKALATRVLQAEAMPVLAVGNPQPQAAKGGCGKHQWMLCDHPECDRACRLVPSQVRVENEADRG